VPVVVHIPCQQWHGGCRVKCAREIRNGSLETLVHTRFWGCWGSADVPARGALAQ
jgi:hypothetical protein